MNLPTNGDEWDDTELIKAYNKAVKNWRKPQNMENEAGNAETNGPGPWISVEKPEHADLLESTTLAVGTWVLGSPCRSVWTYDGLEYEAKIVAIEGPKCTIRFVGYGNQEGKNLTELKDTFGKRSRDRQRREAQMANSQLLTPCANDGEDYFSSVSLTSSLYNNCPSIPNDREEDRQTTTTECSGTVGDSVSSSSTMQKSHKLKSAGKRKRDDPADTMSIDDPQEPDRLEIDEHAEEVVPSGAEATMGSSSSSDISEAEDGDDEATSGGVFADVLKGFPSMVPRFPVPPMPMSLADSNGKFDFGRGQLPSLLLSWYMSGYHAGYFDAQQEKASTSKHVRGKDESKPRSKRQQ